MTLHASEFHVLYGSSDTVRVIKSGSGMDDLGFEPLGGGGDFKRLSRPAPRPSQPPVRLIFGLFPGEKQLGSGVDHPQPSSANFK